MSIKNNDHMATALAGLDTRAMVRVVANHFVSNADFPSSEKVRKFISDNTDSNPSTTTVQDEMKKWQADTFWPTFQMLGTLPDAPGVSHDLRRIFQDAFQMIVVGAIDTAKKAWDVEREAHVSEIQQVRSLLQIKESECMDLQAQLAEAKLESEAFSATIDGLQEEISKQSRLLVEVTRELHKEQSRTRDLQEEITQAEERAQRALDALQKDLDAVRGTQVADRQQLELQRAENLRLSEELVQSQIRASKAEGIVETLKTTNDDLQEKIAQLQRELGKVNQHAAERPMSVRERIKESKRRR